MRDARKPVRWSVTLVAFTLAAAGCQLFVDLDGLEDMSCPPDYKACNGGCVSELETATGCGGPSCNPCAPKHAEAICDDAHRCSFGTCIGDWADCNNSDDDGCEKDLAHDKDHCGECRHECTAPPHATAGCSAKNCAIGKCDDGWADCDRNPLNGCERPIWNDQQCVSCDIPCADGTHCDRGICRVPVPDGGSVDDGGVD